MFYLLFSELWCWYYILFRKTCKKHVLDAIFVFNKFFEFKYKLYMTNTERVLTKHQEICTNYKASLRD